MVKKLSKLILPIILILIGVQFTRDYFGERNKQRKEELTALKTEGKRSTAILDSKYDEKTIKVLGVPMKLYIYDYQFSVNGKIFKGKLNTESPLSQTTQEVSYFEHKPSINSINIDEELKLLETSENSKFPLLIGLVALLLGAFLGYQALKPQKERKKSCCA